MRISVPDDVIPALTSIAAMSDTEFQAAVSRIGVGAAEPIYSNQYKNLIEAAESLEIGRDTLGLDKSNFVTEVTQSLIDSKKLELNELASNIFNERLTVLISIQWIQIKAKASSLWLESERFAVGSRILTDIRPIFSDDPNEITMASSLIIHTLKLDYNEQGNRESIFVVLDDEDIESLRLACVRAQAKEKALRNTLNQTNVNISDLFGKD